MKTLKLLSALLFLICSSFSTIATAQQKNLDTLAVKRVVILDSLQGKNVISDLIAGDACFKEIAVTRFVLKLTEKKSELQQAVIKNLEDQKATMIKKDKNKDLQIESKDKIIKDTEKQLSKVNTVSWFWKGLAIAGTISTAALLLSR